MQLGDQPLRGDAGVPIDQTADTAGPVHAGTLATCCNRPHARRRCRDAVHGAGATMPSRRPIESLDDGRMTDLYAYPDDLRSCWVRGNMIASIDGGATDDGKAGGLAGRRRPRGVRAHAPARRRHPGRRGHRRGSRTTRARSSARHSARPGSAAGRPRCRPSPWSPTAVSSTTTPSCSPAPRCRR